MPSTLDETIQVISVDDAIIALGLHESNYAQVERLVNVASARLESYCRTKFKSRTLSLTRDGTSSSLLDLGAPIVSVTSVQLGDVVLSEVAGDYQVLNERGELFRLTGWTDARGKGAEGVRNVLVTAILGYQVVPYEVQEAALAIVRGWLSGAGGGGGLSAGVSGGLQSEKIGDYSYTRFGPGVSNSASSFFGVSVDIGEAVASLVSSFVRHGF